MNGLYNYRMSGAGNLGVMSHLGADPSKVAQAQAKGQEVINSDPGLANFIAAMYDGSLAKKLTDQVSEIRAQQRSLMATSAEKQKAPEFLVSLNSTIKARNALNKSIKKYNGLAGTINTVSDTYGLGRPMTIAGEAPTMPGLGLLPALAPIGLFVTANPVAGAVIIFIGAVVLVIGLVIIYELIQLILEAVGLVQHSKSLVEQFAGPAGIFGGAADIIKQTGNVAIVGLIGFGVFILWNVLKKKGHA